MELRVGFGYDVHRLVRGRKLLLGGVEIPYKLGLDGHSDADVLIHAIMDALLGASGMGDIGSWFPPTDERYEGASSKELLRVIVNKMKEEYYNIKNVDATIVAEEPHLEEFIPAMRESLASLLEVEIECVNIKVTTKEGLGAIGKGEGIESFAVVLISR